MGGNLDAAIESLLNVKKQTRLAGDVAGTKNAVIEIIKLCYQARAWKTLNDQIALLSKGRGQVKQAVTAMVQQAMHYIDDTPDTETRIELIKTLNSVSAGKIYVEIEWARLIKRLAEIKEEQGLIAEAADLMQEIAVETFGAMAKTEKIAFILEQGRLCLDRQDYVCVPKSSQGKLVLEPLMPILQRRKNRRRVIMLLRRLPQIYLHS